MPSALEQRLAERLHDVGALLPDALEPPRDLDARVARVHSRRRRRGLSALSIAAALVFILGTATVVARDRGGRARVDVNAPTQTDPLPAGTVMLDARRSWVVAVDLNGHQVATLVSAARGTVIDAQLTGDHRFLWYLSVAGRAGTDCGEVVRADVARGTSEIVARAVSFAISPDGARLALAGGGDLTSGGCSRLLGATRAKVAVTDLNTRETSTWIDEASPQAYAFNQMRWSNDGRNVVTRICGTSCEALVRFEVPAQLGPALTSHVVTRSGFLGVRPPAAFGPDGSLYLLERNVTDDWRDHRQQLVVYNGQTFARQGRVLSVDYHWELKEVVPTEAGVFVVGTPRDEFGNDTGPTGLYGVENERLVHVKDFDYGVMTPAFAPR